MSSTDKDPFLPCDGIDASEESKKAFLNGNLMSPETRTETRHGTQDRVH